MRALLAFACRAFPPEHRARRSDEVVDTALLAADGSPWRAAREALSLVAAGVRQRLHASEGDTSVQDGVALLAGVVALVNLAIALYGISFAVKAPPPLASFGPLGFTEPPDPYVVDWWWIAFAVAAAGIVLGLVLGNRRLALGAALANLCLVGYDALVLDVHGRGHFNAIAFWRGPAGYPIAQEWLAPAVLLALATAVAPLRRRALRRFLPGAFVAAALLVVLARHDTGGFIFLRWPLGMVIVLAATLGWLAPRLAVVALGVSAILAPYVVEYLSTPPGWYKAPAVSWVAAPGLAVGILLPLAYLVRRRLT